MVHELFHLYTRGHPKEKEILYRSIGFSKFREIEFPNSLKNKKITNPDAPINDSMIKVRSQNDEVWVMPILYSSSENYSLKKGGEFFSYLQFKLLVLADKNRVNTYNADKPVILDVSQVKGFFEQIGKNTKYILHPEEILADNFAALVLKKDKMPSPEILEKIRKVFTSFK